MKEGEEWATVSRDVLFIWVTNKLLRRGDLLLHTTVAAKLPCKIWGALPLAGSRLAIQRA
jgi:hypothetical protein